MTKKLIELWKTDCEDCEAAKSIIADLEAEGYLFEKHNIMEPEGQRLWDEYEQAIDEFSRSQGWETGYIYTPTFVNPSTGKVLGFSDRPPKKEELIEFASL